jgi:cobalt/nickel transport protein
MPIEWQSKDGPVHAYEASLPRNATRSLGDYVFVFQPAPYLEKQEDKFIQQFTKTMVNVGGVPGNWAEPVGLPTEIVPLDKPYANWTGACSAASCWQTTSPFRTRSSGQYVNYPLDIDVHRFAADAQVAFPRARSEPWASTRMTAGVLVGPRVRAGGASARSRGPKKSTRQAAVARRGDLDSSSGHE